MYRPIFYGVDIAQWLELGTLIPEGPGLIPCPNVFICSNTIITPLLAMSTKTPEQEPASSVLPT